MCMGCGEDDMTDDVILFEFASGHTAAAAALRLKRRGGNRFHVLCLGHDNDELFIFNEIFDTHFAFVIGDCTDSVSGKVIADRAEFVFNHATKFLIVGQDRFELFDVFADAFEF